MEHGDSVAAQLGRTVAERRRQLSLTQQTLADISGVSVRFVNSLEAGKPTARLSGVVAVLDALGLDLVARRRSS